MDLLCTESVADGHLIAPDDCAISRDPRVIQNLLDIELFQASDINHYFNNNFQDDLLPKMRHMVTTWMLEVCEEQYCEPQVCPLAITLLDRFLTVCRISHHQLQLAGAVCLLIASKCRQCRPLSVDLLCFYTDHSVSAKLMKDWEMLILSKLQWNVNPVTGFDFVDQLIARCESIRNHTLVRRHAHTLLALAYSELHFLGVKPSTIAASCLVAASRGLRVVWDGIHALSQMLPDLNRSDVDQAVYNIEQAIFKQLRQQQQQQLQQQQPQDISTPSTNTTLSSTTTPSTNTNKLNSSLDSSSDIDSDDETSQPATPKDVQDIDF